MLKFSFRACFFLMATILVIACSNFIVISCGVQKNIEIAHQSLSKINSTCMTLYSANEDNHKEIKYVNDIKNSLMELESLKKGIFDSNTITFLASFVLVFLGGILFDIEKRAKDKYIKSKEITKKIETQSQEIERWFEIELNQLKIDKQISALVILKNYLQFQFSVSKYQINGDIISIMYKLHDTLKDVLSLLEDKQTKYITEEAKAEYMRQLHDVQLLLEKEEIHINTKNTNKLTPIFESLRLVSNCINAINRIELYFRK